MWVLVGPWVCLASFTSVATLDKVLGLDKTKLFALMEFGRPIIVLNL